MRTVTPFEIQLKLNFSAGCKCSCTELKIPVDFEVRIHLCSAIFMCKLYFYLFNICVSFILHSL